jgi:hypothetical protein
MSCALIEVFIIMQKMPDTLNTMILEELKIFFINKYESTRIISNESPIVILTNT